MNVRLTMEDVTTTVLTLLEVSSAAVILDMSWMMMDSHAMVRSILLSLLGFCLCYEQMWGKEKERKNSIQLSLFLSVCRH